MQSTFFKKNIYMFLLFVCLSSLHAKTRWSTHHVIPDADFLEAGRFVLDAHGYYFDDLDSGNIIKPAGLVNIGISEWINVELGYAGGFTMGFKARILGETKPFVPSLALGINNIFSHKEAYHYNYPADSISNELFVVLGKSIELIKLRFQLGIQSIPEIESEQFNPFLGIEKYFGKGLYLTLEIHRRDKEIVPSVFANFRFWKQRLELSGGMVDLAGIFENSEGKTDVSFASQYGDRFSRPGVWVGLRFQGKLKFGSADGFTGLEDRIAKQSESINMLRTEIDSMKSLVSRSGHKMESMNTSLKMLTDSVENNQEGIKKFVMQKLVTIRTLYAQEPFEPEQVKITLRELTMNRDKIIPSLTDIALDRKEDFQIRTTAISVLGGMGLKQAADVLIEILAQVQNPGMKIEALIGLGKLKETRAVFLMQQLANDPNDAVAFTASEVLQKLEKETGIILSSGKTTEIAPQSIPESKIGFRNENKATPVPVEIATEVDQTLQLKENLNVTEKPEFTESTIASEEKLQIDSIAPPMLQNDSVSLAVELERDSVSVGKKSAVVVPAKDKKNKPKKEKRAKKPEGKDW